MRSVPRWNGSTGVETSWGGERLPGIFHCQHHRLGTDSRRYRHGALFGQIVDDGVVNEIRGEL